MAFAFRERELGFKDTGTPADVPGNAKARLMYYLNCVSSLLKSVTEDLDRKYMDYKNYNNLSDQETANLVAICEALSPAVLNDKCFFRHDELCEKKDTGNVFLDISSKETTFVAARSVVVMGRELMVMEVMVYSGSWMNRNYYSALSEVKSSLRPPSPVQYGPRRRSSSCIVL